MDSLFTLPRASGDAQRKTEGRAGRYPPSRRALSSSAACRFIPVDEFPIWTPVRASYVSPALDTTNLRLERRVESDRAFLAATSREAHAYQDVARQCKVS
jgi:hypothetical protein